MNLTEIGKDSKTSRMGRARMQMTITKYASDATYEGKRVLFQKTESKSTLTDRTLVGWYTCLEGSSTWRGVYKTLERAAKFYCRGDA